MAGTTAGVPWMEKHRPTQLEDVVGQREHLIALRRAIQSGAMPHILFAGSPGTGKTTTAFCVCREIVGAERFAHQVLVINASKERGPDTIRAQVRRFLLANQQPVATPPVLAAATATATATAARGMCFVVLDEADSLTDNCTALLEMLLDDGDRLQVDSVGASTSTTLAVPPYRLFLCCNDLAAIPASLQSRCLVMTFRRLEPADIRRRLLRVLEDEKQPHAFRDDAIDALVDAAQGDLRVALNAAQSVLSLAAVAGNDANDSDDADDLNDANDTDSSPRHDQQQQQHGPPPPVSAATVLQVTDAPPTVVLREAWSTTVHRRQIGPGLEQLQQLHRQGYNVHDLLHAWHSAETTADAIAGSKIIVTAQAANRASQQQQAMVEAYARCAASRPCMLHVAAAWCKLAAAAAEAEGT